MAINKLNIELLFFENLVQIKVNFLFYFEYVLRVIFFI